MDKQIEARRYGTVIIDDTIPPGVTEPYVFFACTVTGINGELYDTVAADLHRRLASLDPEHAQAILRAAGDHVGGDCSEAMTRLLNQQTELGADGRLRFPGVLKAAESGDIFVDASGQEHAVLGRSAWRQHHGAITGVPMGMNRDVWCGGTPDAPRFYGSQQADSPRMTMVRFGDSGKAPKRNASPARRRSPR